MRLIVGGGVAGEVLVCPLKIFLQDNGTCSKDILTGHTSQETYSYTGYELMSSRRIPTFSVQDITPALLPYGRQAFWNHKTRINIPFKAVLGSSF